MDQPARKRWTFKPPDAAAFERSESRVFLVGLEPNGNNYAGPKDTGYWFRQGLQTWGFGNLKFLRASLLCLEGVLRPLTVPPWPDWWEKEKLARAQPLLNHLLHLDLSPFEGGARLGGMESRVRRYVEGHPEEIIGYWERWGPTHTVLLGRVAQGVFEDLVAPKLRGRGMSVQRMGWPHPSANGYHEADLARLQTDFHPLDRPIQS